MIKVMVVDDQTLLKETLLFMLKQDDSIEGYDGGTNGYEAIKNIELINPDVILMDLRMPQMGGIEATKRIKEINSKIKVVILTTFEEEDKIIESISIGADGYIVKDIKPDTLILAVKSAYHGLHVMHRHIIDMISYRIVKSCEIENHTEALIEKFQLTLVEISIIKLLADGKSNREIACEMNFTEGTIKNKVSKLLSKIGLKDRTQVVVYALKQNLI